MIKLVNITDIKPNPDNPRTINDDKFKKLVKSIKEFPQMLKIRPIVVDNNMIVLGGNMRLKACKEAGLTKVHIIKADDLTEEQQKQFIIKDNVGFGEWDWEMLANDWDSVELEEWGLDIPEFFEEKEKEEGDSSRGGSYNDEELPEIEPYKLAYRLEAMLEIERNKIIELFGGRKALTYWYDRSFKKTITNDMQVFEDVEHDYNLKANDFIKKALINHMDFDYIDFDDEGCPAKEIQEFFKIIKGKKKDPFILAITDGQGLNLKCMGKINYFKTYMIREDETIQATTDDYYGFKEIFRESIKNITMYYGFKHKELSLHLKDNGNVIYATFLIERA